MNWLRLFLSLLSALISLYFFLFWKQLRLMRKEVKQIVTLRLLFVSLFMMLVTAVLTVIILTSFGIGVIVDRIF